MKVQELESELLSEQKQHNETTKEVRKNDRKQKELSIKLEEDQKSQMRLQDFVDKLHNKLKVYKKQLEEAEEISQLNLNKYRKVQHLLDDAEERASNAETQLNKLRVKNRCSFSITHNVSPFREIGQSASRASSVVPTRASSVYRT